ncbi:MAG: S8 family serine peptidase, partial [bacterium]|nr:S8 family serine peptidase [bacterium]
APESEIIFVKGLNSEVDASAFIYAKAQALGRPAAINYSAGSHWGAHDGKTLGEVALEELATSVPGRAFVTAAGNEGDAFIHWGGFDLEADSLWTYYMGDISGDLPDNDAGGKVKTFEVNGVISNVPTDADAENTFIAVGVDSTGVSGSTITAMGSRGQTKWYDLISLLLLPGSSSDTLRYGNGDIAGIVSISVAGTGNDDGKLLVTVAISDFISSHDSAGFDAVGADLWRFMAKGKSPIHMWSENVWSAENESVNIKVTDSRYRATDNNYSVGIPATAARLISVGAYTNRAINTETAEHGALASFSSKGPTADGRNKPDIVSPGQFVFSALSTASTGSDPATVDAKGLHYREEGTSMASPITAGSVALYLQKNPKATYPDIFAALTKYATQDNFTASNGSLPNTYWGYGKLNLFAMMTDGQTPNINALGYPTEPVARTDFSGDGIVGFSDFITFAGAFGKKTTDSDFNPRIDLNDDGSVNFPDFILFARLFGQKVPTGKPAMRANH